MPSRKGHSWIKFFVKDWMTGTSQLELTQEEQGIWFNLLARAGNDGFTRILGMIASGKDKDGRIIGHPLETLALSIRCSVDLLRRTLDKFVSLDKITIDKILFNGIECYTIKINNWNKYQSDYMRIKDWRQEKKAYRDKAGTEPPPPKAKPKDNPALLEIINYLNETSGKRYTPTPGNVKHINARLSEGFTVEQFKKVIDVKVLQWKGTEHDKFIRPSTLFNSEKFEGYLNESQTENEPTKWD